MLASLRARLFAAIALVALLSLALALAIGAVLTRQAVERNTLQDVSAQFDLLVEREREALVPFAQAPLAARSSSDAGTSGSCRSRWTARPTSCRPSGRRSSAAARRLDGTLETDGTRYFYSARLVNGKGFMLLRPVSSTNSAWRPHVKGLIFAALATAALAALAAFLLARAISRPVRRVAEATRGLARATGSRRSSRSRARASSRCSAESFNDLAVELTKAREAERAFLLSVSHELKTPLTAIRGYAEGLARGRAAGRRGGGDDREGVAAPRAARRRPARPRRGCGKAEFSVRREPVDLGRRRGARRCAGTRPRRGRSA